MLKETTLRFFVQGVFNFVFRLHNIPDVTPGSSYSLPPLGSL